MGRDIVEDLGLLTLGSRFKRVGERLQADATRIAAARGANLAASQYPLLAALDEMGSATIGELSAALGLAQPGVTRSVRELTRQGVVRMRKSREDARQHIAALTTKGQAEVALGRSEIWPIIEAAVRDLCAGLDGTLLEQLGGIEAGLTAEPLEARAERMRRQRP